MKKTLFAITFITALVGCGPETYRRPLPCATTGGRSGSGGARTGGAPGTGGRGSGGAATGGMASGGASSGGAGVDAAVDVPGTGGMASGGASSGGAPATGGAAGSTIVWRDGIQSGTASWGFNELLVERPIDNAIVGSDARGGNLSRVTDPAGGAGYAMRHLCAFDQAGCRSEIGIWSFENAVFSAQAKSAAGVWVAMEWYFPAVVRAASGGGWLNLWDWHSLDTNGGNRWHTSPGLMLAEDGSMKVRWEWGGDAQNVNTETPFTTMALPVGRWVDVEMHYVWTTTRTRLELWVDGQLALTTDGVTRRTSAGVVEMYSKWYGSNWTPSPAVRYTRNVRIGTGRIWPQK